MANTDLDLAERLIESAQTSLKGEYPEAAIWRLADAIGAIAATIPPERRESLMGLGIATGRGNRCITK